LLAAGAAAGFQISHLLLPPAAGHRQPLQQPQQPASALQQGGCPSHNILPVEPQMRQRTAAGSDRAGELLDEDMLETHQQEEVIADLRKTLVAHARTWRALFGALGLSLAALFAYFAATQAAAPWVSFRHHSEFKETLSAGAVAAAEAASAACLAAPAAVLLRFMPAAASTVAAGGGRRGGGGGSKGLIKAPQLPGKTELRVLNGALAVAAAMAVFWVRALLAAGRTGLLAPEQQLRNGWLPAAPLAFALLAGSVARQYGDTAEKLEGLEAQMYAHETA